MAAPDPLAGTAVKVTMFFNWQNQGWTESYWYKVADAGSPLNVAYNAGRYLAGERRKYLYNEAEISGIRASLVGTPNVSLLKRDKNQGNGPGLDTGEPLPCGTALFVRVQDSSATYSEERAYRGITKAFAGANAIGKDGVIVTTPMQRWVSTLQLAGTVPYVEPGNGGTAKLGIRARNKTSSPATPVPILAVGLNNRGRLTFTLYENQPSYSQGAEFAVKVNRLRCVRGINGRYKVRAASFPTGTTVVETTKTFCCNPADLLDVYGQAQIVGKEYFPWATAYASSLGHKNTGRPFFSTRGRQSAKCC